MPTWAAAQPTTQTIQILAIAVSCSLWPLSIRMSRHIPTARTRRRAPGHNRRQPSKQRATDASSVRQSFLTFSLRCVRRGSRDSPCYLKHKHAHTHIHRKVHTHTIYCNTHTHTHTCQRVLPTWDFFQALLGSLAVDQVSLGGAEAVVCGGHRGTVVLGVRPGRNKQSHGYSGDTLHRAFVFMW